jgi:hypothetical protein
VEAGDLAQKKQFNPLFPLEKPVPSQGHYSFPVVNFRFGLFMTMVVCLSLQTRAFVFSNLLLPIFIDNIIISINWNCVVIFVIVSFIIGLLNLHYHITRQRKMSWIIHYQLHNDFGYVTTES